MDGDMANIAKRAIYRTWMTDSRRWDGYRSRPGDIIVATYPKCGTTWMQRIVDLLIFQTPEPRDLGDLAPWIDRRIGPPVEALFARLDAQTHRRALKSHMPLDALPYFDDMRYIHVARDGRDACMSYHNQITRFKPEMREALTQTGLEDETIGKPFPKFPDDVAAYFRMWLNEGVGSATDGTPFLSYFDLERTYWAERHRPNLLMVHYRDLKTDLAGEMRRVAEFLDIKVPETVFPLLVKAATFEEMRRSGDQLMPRLMTSFVGGTDRFFFKGENERWRNVFSTSDLDLYDQKLRAKLTPACSLWLERGRLGCGVDPRHTPDCN
jgi:aryl sulfotransferase